MRTTLLSLVVAAAGLGALGPAPPVRPEDSAQPRRLSTKPTRATPPAQARIDAMYPPTQPYRARFLFPEDPPERPKPYDVRDVSLNDDYLVPPFLYIPAGMTVRWTNRGRHVHSSTADWMWESGDLKPGQSFSVKFTRPGRYPFYCRHHPGWMQGVIIVSRGAG